MKQIETTDCVKDDMTTNEITTDLKNDRKL